MDETQKSRTSDAAAVRKRRSSILKNQRAPRTPFSELEFNVATPTDTAKSRRVSFSKRTGVAEFVTNEATTTWKNFYEEHNKSLESSCNDSQAHPPRQPIGHIGKRIFDQQFVEAEAVDFISGPNNPTGLFVHTSLNNVNFTQQIASLECTGDDRKLPIPKTNFELSMFTDHHSKLFGDDLTVAGVGETSERINVNFSNVLPIGEGNDDLDEIQRDLQRAGSNIVCHGRFANRKSMSEYIEVDLNTTHVSTRRDSEMSITDTVLSPKVQDISKSVSIDKKLSVSKDLVLDKENIAINPYVTPCESVNFAINEEPDQVLVFDGKRLTLQSERDNRNYRNTLLPDIPAEQTPQRKTIVLNINDDLPNFIEDLQLSKNETIHSKNIVDNEEELPITEQKQANTAQRRRTILYNDDVGDISVTQAVPTNIIVPEISENVTDKHRTIIYGNDTLNISITQALPANIIQSKAMEKRRTILYEDGTGNISVTQAVPSNIMLSNNAQASTDKRRTIVFENDAGDISMTQALPANIVAEIEKRTISYDDGTGNISVTQAVPSNIILSNNAQAITNKRRTILFENDAGDISMTEALPANIVAEKLAENRTISYEDGTGNVSVTQAVSSNIVLPAQNIIDKSNALQLEHDTRSMSMTQALPANIVNEKHSEKRKTILYENDTGNISVTEALSANIMQDLKKIEKRRTIMYGNDTGNISITEALPANIMQDVNKIEKRRTILYGNDTGNISTTQAIPANILENATTLEQCRTVMFENDTVNISVTQAIPNNVIFPNDEVLCERRRTILYGNDMADISVTQAIPRNIIYDQNETEKNTTGKGLSSNILESENTNVPNKTRTVAFEKKGSVNVSISQAVGETDAFIRNGKDNTLYFNESISNTDKNNSKRKTTTNENDTADISVTKAISNNIILSEIQKSFNNRDTIVFEDNADVSMTGALPNILLDKCQILDNSKINEGQDFLMKDINKDTIKETKRKTIESKDINISVNQIVPHRKKNEGSSQIVLDVKKSDISMSTSQIARDKETAKRKTIVFENDLADISMTKPIPAEIISNHNKLIDEPMLIENNLYDNIATNHVSQDILVYQAATTHSIPKIQAKRTEQGVLKSEKTISSDIIPSVSETAENFIDIKSSLDTLNKENSVMLLNKKETKEKDVVENKPNISKTFDCESKMHEEILKENRPKESILNDLLDMSRASMESGIDDKNVMAELESEKPSVLNVNTKDPAGENKSSESFFYITKDSDEEAQTDKYYEQKEKIEEKSPQIKAQSSPSLEYTEQNPDPFNNLQQKLVELKSIIYDNKDVSPKNRHYEKMLSTDLENVAEKDEDKSHRERLNESRDSKVYKTADDTNELLQMLSDFTDNQVSEFIEEDEKPEPVVVKSHIAIENKSEINDTRRLSIVPRKQSIVLSREDLLKNISMAQAVLQQSKFELDDSESMDDDTSRETPVEQKSPRKKSVRLSTEVVKTLNFEEDDTTSETSIKSDKVSPLKKTAFGETSYMKENKAKVIPTYLKDVSDGLKELMTELVKPAAETMPFEAGFDKGARKSPSMCSTQIQANLITSSQIDVSAELYSNPESIVNLRNSLVAEISGLGNRAVARVLKSAIKPVSTATSEKSSEIIIDSETSFKEYVIPIQPVANQTRVIPKNHLVFDHNNPLNNVILGPIDYSEVHRYNPTGSTETLCGSERSQSVQLSFSDIPEECEVDRVSMQYNVQGGVGLPHLVQPSGDTGSEKVMDTQSINSNISKPMSIDQSIDAKMMEVKDIEVNTVIAMKGNKELLDASSSLTLVDDALTHNAFDVDIDTNSSTGVESPRPKKLTSPVKVIYKIEEHSAMELEKVDSDLTSNDEEIQEANFHTKPKKRNYSPTKRDRYKHCTLSTLDVTPKPMNKMQKLSDSPKITKSIANSSSLQKLYAEMDAEPEKDVQGTMTTKEEKLSPKNMSERQWTKKSKVRNPGTNVTVQQLITEYQIGSELDEKALNKEILNALKSDSSSTEPITASQSATEECKSLDMASSFTSSNDCENNSVICSQPVSMSSVRSKGSRMDWHPELINELSSKNLVSECESGVNVVAKLDMLPFMGSQECEWESSCPDTWSFRLLHARVRLIVRLAHRHDNATRTRVRADTPVLDVLVEIAVQDTKNSVAALCVRFAAEAMRCVSGRGCVRAGDVPALVRRCAAVARVALRWGRAMHDARARLACTLTDTRLALKVANIPLRSVWEVTMRLEMVVEDARETPWPRAGDVRVTRVVSECHVSENELRRLTEHVPRDWGHVPRTLWRIFKYLKHKTRDDELLGI